MIEQFVPIVFSLVLFRMDAFAREAVSVSTSGPSLVWKKSFEEEIGSVMVSKDGEHIAIADRGGFLGESQERFTVTSHGGVLRYLDAKGKELWQYRYSRPKNEKLATAPGGAKPVDKYRLTHIVMSDNGQRIACTLEQLHVWKRAVTETSTGRTHDQEFSGYFPKKILYLSSDGKLLWEFGAEGYPEISPDGQHVFVVPEADEGGNPFDKFYFLNNNGQMLWTEPEMKDPEGGFSDDGRYVFTKSAMFDKKHNAAWRLSKWEFFLAIKSSVACIEKFFESPDKTIASKLQVYDLESRNLLWEKEVQTLRGGKEIPRRYFEEVGVGRNAELFAISDKYIIAPWNGKVSVLDKKTGAELREWMFEDYKEGHWYLPIITKDEKHLFLFSSGQARFYGIDGARKFAMSLIDLNEFTNSAEFNSLASQSGKFLLIVSRKAIRFYDSSEYLR